MEPGKVWRQKDGSLVLIRHMTDRHLSNAIRMCERKRDELRGESPLDADHRTWRKRIEKLEGPLIVLYRERERRKVEEPLPGELAARAQREMEELLWDVVTAVSRSISQSQASTASSSASTPSGQGS